MRRFIIAIDDTDNETSIGTGRLARMLGDYLEEQGCGQVRGVTRHQLLVDPRIPYTSHNSAAAMALMARDEAPAPRPICELFLGAHFHLTAFLAALALGQVRRVGAGTLFGLISGILALILGLGKGGLFEPLRWILPFSLLDLLLLAGLRPERGWPAAAVAGASAGLTRAASGLGVDWAVGLPMDWALTTFAIKAATHTAFGALGAALAVPVLRRLPDRFLK